MLHLNFKWQQSIVIEMQPLSWSLRTSEWTLWIHYECLLLVYMIWPLVPLYLCYGFNVSTRISVKAKHLYTSSISSVAWNDHVTHVYFIEGMRAMQHGMRHTTVNNSIGFLIISSQNINILWRPEWGWCDFLTFIDWMVTNGLTWWPWPFNTTR